MVVLTLNEETNIGGCLASLAAQRNLDFEILVIDAASSDRTASVVRELQACLPVPLRLHVAARRLPIGEARNLGVALARAPAVAFLSADAELDRDWVDEALWSLAHADLVFSRQLHRPRRRTVGAAVRGSRYHFPGGDAADPMPFASNVAAAYRRDVALAFPFEPWSNAAEDLLLAKRAVAGGRRAAYNPRMVVHHSDVPDARTELRKNLREGYGRGLYRRELGLFWPVLAWAVVLAASPLSGLVLSPLAAFGWFGLVLWAPSLRRTWKRRGRMPARDLAVATAAAPFFDLAFLGAHLCGLAASARRRATPVGQASTEPSMPDTDAVPHPITENSP